MIDWDDCRIGGLQRELAWSVWEFSKNPATGDRLVEARVYDFLRVYRRSGGPMETGDAQTGNLEFLVPWIREHLRHEIRRGLGARAAGECPDAGYLAAESRAFQVLREFSF